MDGTVNARVIDGDPSVLRQELGRLGVSDDLRTSVRDLMPCWIVALEAVDADVTAAILSVLPGLGGAVVPGRHDPPGRLILLGSFGQFKTLRHRLPDGAPGACIDAVLATLDAYHQPRGTTVIGQQNFIWGERTYVMGIVNVTPDSFSGDGLGSDVSAAVAQAERLVADGADIVDVGGESTRPNSERIDASEELRRVLPVVRVLARSLTVPVSIDTCKAAVAERCLDEGAALVNDIWGLRADPEMAPLVARRNVPVVLMHNQRGIAYQDLLADVIRTLRTSLALALAAGVSEQNIIVDPGIGFGKSKEQNLELLHRLPELKVLGRPLLLGTSRKSTIGHVLNLPPDERIEGTAATVALGIAQGTDLVRVHDVREMARVCRMADAVARWRPADPSTDHWLGHTG